MWCGFQIDRIAPAFVTLLARVRTHFNHISVAPSASSGSELPSASLPPVTPIKAAFVDIRLPAHRSVDTAAADSINAGKAAVPNENAKSVDTIVALELALAEVR